MPRPADRPKANRRRICGTSDGPAIRCLYIAPARLYAVLARYRDPRDMLAHEGIADEIDTRRRADLRQALARPPHRRDASGSVYVLPDAAWSRRVLGCLANELANAQPRHAHAVLKLQHTGAYVVSVRAPIASPTGAAVR